MYTRNVNITSVFGLTVIQTKEHAYTMSQVEMKAWYTANKDVTAMYANALLLTWMSLALVASRPLIGTISTMTASPASTEGPNSSHRKTMDRAICRGHDHSRWMKFVTSLNRWASADIRFTVSPTVDSLRVSLDTTKAWRRGLKRRRDICEVLQLLPHMSYWISLVSAPRRCKSH